MAKVYKTLGQAAPAANTATTLYTVPSSPSTQSVISTLSVVNRDSAGVVGSFSIQVVPSGETAAAKHYIEYLRPIAARTSKRLTIGITLRSGDKIVVTPTTANLSFSLFGGEITA